MKYLAFIFLLLCSIAGKAQTFVPGTQNNVTIAGVPVVVSLPNVDTNTVKLHMIIAFSGNGVNTHAAARAQAPSNKWNAASPGNIARDSFVIFHIVRDPLENGGRKSPAAIDGVLTWIKNNCTFIKFDDSTYNSMTGLSQGNQEVFRYLSDAAPVFNSYTPLYRNKFSKEVLLSNGADEDATGYRGTNQYKPSGTRVWYGATDGTTGTFYPNDIYNFMLPKNPAPRTLIDVIAGQGHTSTVWDSAWNTTATTYVRSTWGWLLHYSYGSSNVTPVANAGTNQVLALGTTSTSLSASASTDPDGSITTYAWTQIAGASSTIVSASSVSTNITGLTTGYYRYRLLVTDNLGATNADTINVVVTGTRHVIPKRTDNVFRKGSLNVVFAPQNLFDNDVNTSINPSGFSAQTIDYPTTVTYMLDSNYNNIVGRIYNQLGGGRTYPVRFYNHDRTQVTNLSYTTGVNGTYVYIDSNESKGVPHDVRWIEIDILSSSPTISEIELEGYTLGVATPVFPTQSAMTPLPMEHFLGTAINGDEPDTLLHPSAGTIRPFHNFSYYDTAATYNPSARSFINSYFGGDHNDIPQRRKNAGLFVQWAMYGSSRAFIRPTVPSSPLSFADINTENNKNMPVGADSTLPSSWLASAQFGYHISVWGGRNTSANYNPAHSWTSQGGVPITQKALGYIDAYEEGNESNAPWSEARYQNSQVRMAKQSAVYDGHKNTMGSYVGVKNADPTMKVSVGAIVSGDSLVIKSDALYNYYYRGYNDYSWDRYTVNWYFTPTGEQSAQIPSPYGTSPGQFDWFNRAKRMVAQRDRYMGNGNIRIGLGEFGWDKNQLSPYSALKHGTIDSLHAQANFIVQAFIMGRAAKLDFMYQYRSRDESVMANNGGFNTSGQFMVYPAPGFRWPANYWMSTNLEMLKRYDDNYPITEADGDSTGYYRFKFYNNSPTDTVTVVVFHGGVSDFRSTYPVTVGSTSYCEVVRMQDGSLTGQKTVVVPSGGVVSLANAGEEPIYVRYVPLVAPGVQTIYKVPYIWRPN